MPDSSRFFNVEQVPASDLDALLAATERDGHRLIHLRAERRAGTTAYVYTVFFKKAPNAAAVARTTEKPRQRRPQSSVRRRGS